MTLHSSMLHPASVLCAPASLSNSLYPLQNAVAALHGYKGRTHLPPLHPTSAHTTGCYFHVRCSDLTNRCTCWRVLTTGAPSSVETHISNPATAVQSSRCGDLSLNMPQLPVAVRKHFHLLAVTLPSRDSDDFLWMKCHISKSPVKKKKKVPPTHSNLLAAGANPDLCCHYIASGFVCLYLFWNIL